MPSTHGLITHASPYSVPETLDRLESILRAKNITVFARIDHSGEAARVGLTIPSTQLLIFGNPKGRHADHARCASLGNRSSTQDPRLAGH